MDAYTDNLINLNKLSGEHIADLETTIQDIKIKTDKDKANFGNLCILLKSFRIINETTEAMLFNEDILKTSDGSFYKKIKIVEEHTEPDKTENTKLDNE